MEEGGVGGGLKDQKVQMEVHGHRAQYCTN